MKKSTLISALTKNKNKRRPAFEELEKEMRILDVEHQKTIKGGVVYDPNGIFAQYKTTLQTAINNYANKANLTSAEQSTLYAWEDMLSAAESMELDENNTFSLAVQSGMNTEGITGYSSENAFASFFQDPGPGGTVKWDIIAHEMEHLRQYQTGELVPNSTGFYTKEDEFESYKKYYIAQKGKQYFEDQAYYDQKIRNFIDENYKGIEWASGGSTGSGWDGGEISTGWHQ